MTIEKEDGLIITFQFKYCGDEVSKKLMWELIDLVKNGDNVPYPSSAYPKEDEFAAQFEICYPSEKEQLDAVLCILKSLEEKK